VSADLYQPYGFGQGLNLFAVSNCILLTENKKSWSNMKLYACTRGSGYIAIFCHTYGIN